MAKRKIYKDFTLEEYDVFTLDMKCEGALEERKAIIEELQRRKIQILELTKIARNTELGESASYAIEGISVAIGFIEKLRHYEDRCGCPECGAI